jgi:hypothetical protein
MHVRSGIIESRVYKENKSWNFILSNVLLRALKEVKHKSNFKQGWPYAAFENNDLNYYFVFVVPCAGYNVQSCGLSKYEIFAGILKDPYPRTCSLTRNSVLATKKSEKSTMKFNKLFAEKSPVTHGCLTLLIFWIL